MSDMSERIKRYQRAGLNAVEFQLKFQQPDGSFIWDDKIRDAYHKQTYSWAMAGRYDCAHRLLNWIKANTLQPDGQLKDYNGDVYKQSWFFQGVHRLGRFDISYKVMDWLVSNQDEHGGLPFMAANPYARALSTAWTGISALYLGRMEVAGKAAQWCVSMLEQNHDDTRFYVEMTRDGKLVTAEVDPNAQCIDYAKPKQAYWEVGLPLQLMCRLYTITGDEGYLDLATRFFECHFSFFTDRFTYVGSGKTSLGSALYYLLTDDERAKEAVCNFCDFLCDTQVPDGGWRDETEPDIPLIYIDHAAEFNVWLQSNAAILASKL